MWNEIIGKQVLDREVVYHLSYYYNVVDLGTFVDYFATMDRKLIDTDSRLVPSYAPEERNYLEKELDFVRLSFSKELADNITRKQEEFYDTKPSLLYCGYYRESKAVEGALLEDELTKQTSNCSNADKVKAARNFERETRRLVRQGWAAKIRAEHRSFFRPLRDFLKQQAKETGNLRQYFLRQIGEGPNASLFQQLVNLWEFSLEEHMLGISPLFFGPARSHELTYVFFEGRVEDFMRKEEHKASRTSIEEQERLRIDELIMGRFTLPQNVDDLIRRADKELNRLAFQKARSVLSPQRKGSLGDPDVIERRCRIIEKVQTVINQLRDEKKFVLD